MISRELLKVFCTVSLFVAGSPYHACGEVGSAQREELASRLLLNEHLMFDSLRASMLAGVIPNGIVESMLERKPDYAHLDARCVDAWRIQGPRASVDDELNLCVFSGMISDCYLAVTVQDSASYLILWDTVLPPAYPGPALGLIRLGIEKDSAWTVALSGGPSPGGWANFTLLAWDGSFCRIIGDFTGGHYELLDLDTNGVAEIVIMPPDKDYDNTPIRVYRYDVIAGRYRQAPEKKSE